MFGFCTPQSSVRLVASEGGFIYFLAATIRGTSFELPKIPADLERTQADESYKIGQ